MKCNKLNLMISLIFMASTASAMNEISKQILRNAYSQACHKQIKVVSAPIIPMVIVGGITTAALIIPCALATGIREGKGDPSYLELFLGVPGVLTSSGLVITGIAQRYIKKVPDLEPYKTIENRIANSKMKNTQHLTLECLKLGQYCTNESLIRSRRAMGCVQGTGVGMAFTGLLCGQIVYDNIQDHNNKYRE